MNKPTTLRDLSKGQLFRFTDKNDNRIYEFISFASVGLYKLPNDCVRLSIAQNRIVELIF